MVLGFNKQFLEKIIAGTKTQTIREDKHNRWGVGRLIHFATGVRTKNYNCFKKVECVSIQKFEIRYDNFGNSVIYIDDKMFVGSAKFVTQYADFFIEFVKADGFETPQQFFAWFNKDFTGKIIHWTHKKW